ncbi:hypothetical protein AB1Y20_012590 [Prymnesium parvum]|uniref:Amino acid transporter transmembrane domain-containing protein n=1 Tax=Prymnesium parvum TaxID=97485 RepID=A0AB34IL90_PRYPA|mmetsp:Transcript_28328/g.68940  ORF Transcript_28328/g.68940 Transcript_28328/m.68940 type:complete len:410 (+) Transcript_28328:207-1436(+)
MAAMACYTATIIVKCFSHMRAKPSPPPLGAALIDPTADEAPSDATPPLRYTDIGYAAFGSAGAWFVTVQMHVTLVLVGTIYHMLASENIIQVLADHGVEFSQLQAVLIVAAVVWLHVFLKTLSEVAALSYFNISVNVVLLVIVLIEALTHQPAEPPTYKWFNTDGVLNFGGAFASFGFAFGVHPVLPSVYATMRTPSQYNTMVILTFVGVMCFYLPMACIGYGVYGDALVSGVPIYKVDELGELPAVQVVIVLLSIHLLCSYPIVLNPPELAFEKLWEPELEKTTSTILPADTPPPPTSCLDRFRMAAARYPLLLRVVCRSGFVGFTTIVSATVPKNKFGPFLDLVSSITSTFTVFILPVVFFVKLVGVRNIPSIELAWIVAILVVSCVGAVFGTIEALNDLFNLKLGS